MESKSNFERENFRKNNQEEKKLQSEKSFANFSHNAQDILEKLEIIKEKNNKKGSFLNEGLEYIKSRAERLVKLEEESNLNKYFLEIEENIIKAVEDSGYYGLAENKINNIHRSSAYFVDILFDKENKLTKSVKINIRKNGQQKRHVTPLNIVERILLNSLQEGYTPEDIIKSLSDKVEVFKINLDEDSNNYIQAIFDYFKNPRNQNGNNINILIKIIAQFYHENLYLTMSDACVKIPYKTNNCYLVPTLDFGGDLQIHDGEGSFIVAQLKILDNFEKNISDKKKLDYLNVAQISYIIFSIFDFFPVPEKAKNLIAKPNEKYHRYVDEKIERLIYAVTTHLLFVFEAYPLINQCCGKMIFDDFISYIAEGVTEENLCKVLGVKEIKKIPAILSKKNKGLIIDIRYIKRNLLNTGNNAGFAKQYKKSNLAFTISIKQEIINELKLRNSSFFDILEPKLIKFFPDNKISKRQDKRNIIVCEILRISYFYDSTLNHDFTKLKKYSSSLGINLDVFNKLFNETFIKLLLKLNIRFKNKGSDLIANALKEINNNSEYKNILVKIVQEAISEAYDKSTTSKISITKQLQEITKIFNSVKLLENPTNESIDNASTDSEYLPTNISSSTSQSENISLDNVNVDSLFFNMEAFSAVSIPSTTSKVKYELLDLNPYPDDLPESDSFYMSDEKSSCASNSAFYSTDDRSSSSSESTSDEDFDINLNKKN